jgi:tetratricopeptide (TPR) repeat protein
LLFVEWGNAEQRQGNYKEAAAMYEKACELDPKSSFSFNNWGYALQSLGKTDDAIAKYKRAIELDPTLALPRINLRNAQGNQEK